MKNKNIKNTNNTKNVTSNNMKPMSQVKRTATTPNRANTRTASVRPSPQPVQKSARTSPIVDSPISTDRSKTYIVLVWQSRSAGIIRRIMEVPGTQLTRTLDDIRMQKKAFSFYEKR